MIKIAGLFMLIVFPGMLFAQAPEVRRCEEAFTENGQWRYPEKESLINGLICETEKTAVEQFFKTELNEFEYTVLKREQIVAALREFLHYSGYDMYAEKPLNFCMVLEDARIDESDKNRFKPVQIGKVCNLNRKFIEQEIDRIKSDFVSSLRDLEKLKSVQSMLKNPEDSKNLETVEIADYIHEIETASAADAVSGTACVSLIIYPIELYTGLSK